MSFCISFAILYGLLANAVLCAFHPFDLGSGLSLLAVSLVVGVVQGFVSNSFFRHPSAFLPTEAPSPVSAQTAANDAPSAKVWLCDKSLRTAESAGISVDAWRANVGGERHTVCPVVGFASLSIAPANARLCDEALRKVESAGISADTWTMTFVGDGRHKACQPIGSASCPFFFDHPASPPPRHDATTTATTAPTYAGPKCNGSACRGFWHTSMR